MEIVKIDKSRISEVNFSNLPFGEEFTDHMFVCDFEKGKWINPKIIPYEELKSKYNLDDSEIAYIGDDLIDIPVMEKVAVPIATQNASDPCKSVAVHVTDKSGGEGAFREAVEWILIEQGRLEKVILDLKNQLLNRK